MFILILTMDIIKSIPRKLDQNGFKAVETLWLSYVHLLGVVGFIWFAF
jgi:hypothetical protein